MSTRSIFVVTGIDHIKDPITIRLYKHSDDYPSENLRISAAALERAEQIPQSESGRCLIAKKKGCRTD